MHRSLGFNDIILVNSGNSSLAFFVLMLKFSLICFWYLKLQLYCFDPVKVSYYILFWSVFAYMKTMDFGLMYLDFAWKTSFFWVI